MRYPIAIPSSVPGSGSAVYLHLLASLKIPSELPHLLWYNSQRKKLENKHDPFKGFFPIGKELLCSYGGSEMRTYLFTGKEKNPVYVKDLSPKAKMELGISNDANPADKVYNPNFVPYNELSENTRISNETVSMSLAKSISSFLCTKKDILYTEIDVVNMLITAIKHANSDEMRTILHGNHVAWCAARFVESGQMEEDIKRQFYGQNDIDFYIKDIGTIMPSMLYVLALLGSDPTDVIKNLDYDLYGIEEVAETLKAYMKSEQKKN